MRVSKLGRSILALMSVGLAAPVCAAPIKEEAAAKPAVAMAGVPGAAKIGQARSTPDFAAIAAFVDKLFPPQPAPDPARLALARTSVAAMWPNGAYGRMMNGLMGGMIDHLMQLKASEVPGVAKGSGKTIAPQGDLSLHDKAANKDPYFDQRMDAMRQVIKEEMGRISAIVDPAMRDGLARAMARRFDAEQLEDINRFFATRTGRLFAAQYMELWVDPDTMRSVFGSMPQLVKLIPEMGAKLKAANDKFPKGQTPVEKP